MNSINDNSLLGPGLARRQSSRLNKGNEASKPLDTSLSVLFGTSNNAASRYSPMATGKPYGQQPLPEVKINVAPQFMQGSSFANSGATFTAPQ